MAEDRDSVVFNIRALIVSSKFPVALRNLSRDYETMIGNAIPYRSLNFDSLESFLQSIPTLKVTGFGRDLLVEAVQDGASSHISHMIAKQKTSKKPAPSTRRGGYSSQRGSYRSSYVPRSSAPSSYVPRSSAPSSYVPRSSAPSSYVPRSSAPSSYDPNPSAPSSYAPKPSAPNKYIPKPSAPTKYSASSSHQSHTNNVDPRTNLVVVASDDKRQVSLEGSYNSSKHSMHKEGKSNYEVPPRFQKKYLSSNNTSDDVDSVDYITKDVEETLFLDEPLKPDPRILEIETNIISALKPSQLVAIGQAKREESRVSLSSPNPAPMTLVPKPDEINTTENICLLLNYASAKCWPIPVYNVISRKTRNSPLTYTATVKLHMDGNIIKVYSCYPMEYETSQLAKAYAAKIALEDLYNEEKVKLLKPITDLDKSIINDRVSKIVAGHFNGMFSNTVESLYTEKYMEQLPSDWFNTLSCCPTLSVETTIQGRRIITPKPPVLDLDVNEPIFTPTPQVLVPPEEDIWDVYVTSATSTCQVWVRLIGENYSEKYEELLTNMEQYYKINGLSLIALAIDEGLHYAAESNDGWHRVCITAVNDDTKTVNAFLIDHGDTDIFAFNNLYRLPSEFCALPRQAIQCCLEGLESFNDDPQCSEILSSCEYLIGNSLVAEVNSRNETSGLINVTLFDTSGTDDINVNQKIQECFSSETTYSDPKMPDEGRLTVVYVSHISNRGEVYIQIPDDKFNEMAELILSLVPTEISKHKLTSYRNVKLNKIYLAKYNQDDNWYRAVITSTPSVQQNKIALRFVDFGNSETVSIADIADVDKMPPIISQLPPQAIKVALHTVPYETLNQAQIAYLQSHLQGEDKVVFIKLVNNHLELPEVEIFFKDNCGAGATVYVNHTVTDINEISNVDRFDNNKTNEKALISSNQANGNVESYLNLKKPQFDSYSCQEIRITLTAHPGNFIFQIKRCYEELENLTKELNSFYGKMDLPKLKENDIVIGGLYAAFHNLNWIRVVVTDSITNSKVLVRFVDFGDISMLPVSEMHRLDSRFCENPFTAIKGKLAGIAPLHTDWSVEDCLRFRELVLDKQLAATVVKVVDDCENPMDMVVSLKLTDTLSGKNIVIADVLCEERRAVCVKDM